MTKSPKKIYLLTISLLLTLSLLLPGNDAIYAQTLGGMVAPRPSAFHPTVNARRSYSVRQPVKNSRSKASKRNAKSRVKHQARKPVIVKPLLEIANLMSSKELAEGVTYKFYHGGLNVNLVDVNMNVAQVKVKPVMASSSSFALEEVKNQARKAQAIAAVNANYFKKDGTPLGSLMINGEWVTGPIYDRISLGITKDGSLRMDRLNLHGLLETSNPDLGWLWVNNVNQPRRSGSHLIAYTRRWGSFVRMAYPGTLIAVDNNGVVVDKTDTVVTIPYGGFVLSDSRDSEIAKLNRGDLVNLNWQTNPQAWEDVVDAVSGGPVLIRNNQLYVDLEGEKFRKTWTSSSIQARTAIGLTADHHLLLLTVEGPHTLWDVAKFLHKLGAVAAMNLDGGGSTTMVVNNETVTRNKDVKARRVASSLAIIPIDKIAAQTYSNNDNYVPDNDLFDFSKTNVEQNPFDHYDISNLRSANSQNYNAPLSYSSHFALPDPVVGAGTSANLPENKSKMGKYWHWLRKQVSP